MFLKTILLITVAIATCRAGNGVVEVSGPEKTAIHLTHGQPRFNNLFFDFLLPPACTTCPLRYCDKDPGIILGYCCGCRRAFDILPIFCPPNLFCPAYLRDVCHDYEYMLHCCC